MRGRRLQFAAALIAVALARANAQQTELRAGDKVERRVAGGAPDGAFVRLRTGQFIRAEAVQDGADLVFALMGPDGKNVLEVDSQNGPYGPETVAAIAPASGLYRLVTRIDDPKAAPSAYVLRITALRDATAADVEFAAAYRDYADGNSLLGAPTPDERVQAAPKLRSAIAVFERNGETYLQAQGLYALAASLRNSGDFRGALPIFEQAERAFRSVGDERMAADSTNNEAGILDVLGEPRRALEQYRSSLDAFRRAGYGSREALLLNNIAWTEMNLAMYQEALDHYREALDAARKAGDRTTEAKALTNMAVAYRSLGETDQARTMLEQALAISESINATAAHTLTLRALARLEIASDNPAKAVAYSEQALSEVQTTASLQRDLADALLTAARAHAAAGEIAVARERAGRAAELGRSMQDHRTTASALLTLTETELAAGNNEALPSARLALQEFQTAGDKPGEAAGLDLLARALMTSGQQAEARSAIEASLKLAETLRRGTDSDRLRASSFATRQDSYAFYIDLLMRSGETAAALEAAERSRARGLMDMLAESAAGIREGVDPELRRREQDISERLNAKGARLLPIANSNSPQAAALKREIGGLELEFEQIEAAIRKSSPRYAAITQPAPLTLDRLQHELLDEDTAILEYSIGEQRSFAWAATKDSLRSWEMPGRVALAAMADRAYELLTARGTTVRGESAASRRERIEQADAALPDSLRTLATAALGGGEATLRGKRLVIVPAGELQKIPFAALPEADGEPLVASHEVVVLPSASALAMLRQETAGRKAAPKTLAVFADPVFEPDDPRTRVRTATARPQEGESSRILEHVPSDKTVATRMRIPRLPYTLEEADRILRLAPAGSSMRAVGFDATRAAALAPALRDYRYVHFATHGFLDAERPALSALVLSQVDRDNRPRDGFVRVGDIYNTRLNADLVVLSACQTGLGRQVRGEGLMGLTRAFLYAGASRVIVSLWNVNDRATADLMAELYRGMIGGELRPSEALRQAQLKMLASKDSRSPYYWAAFEQHGDWR